MPRPPAAPGGRFPRTGSALSGGRWAGGAATPARVVPCPEDVMPQPPAAPGGRWASVAGREFVFLTKRSYKNVKTTHACRF